VSKCDGQGSQEANEQGRVEHLARHSFAVLGGTSAATRSQNLHQAIQTWDQPSHVAGGPGSDCCNVLVLRKSTFCHRSKKTPASSIQALILLPAFLCGQESGAESGVQHQQPRLAAGSAAPRSNHREWFQQRSRSSGEESSEFLDHANLCSATVHLPRCCNSELVSTVALSICSPTTAIHLTIVGISTPCLCHFPLMDENVCNLCNMEI
jgi:hypothetical protein